MCSKNVFFRTLSSFVVHNLALTAVCETNNNCFKCTFAFIKLDFYILCPNPYKFGTAFVTDIGINCTQS